MTDRSILPLFSEASRESLVFRDKEGLTNPLGVRVLFYEILGLNDLSE